MSKTNYDDMSDESAASFRKKKGRLPRSVAAIIALIALIVIAVLALAIKSWLDGVPQPGNPDAATADGQPLEAGTQEAPSLPEPEGWPPADGVGLARPDLANTTKAAEFDAVVRGPAEGRVVMTAYTMEAGDTLESVARKFSVTAETIVSCNAIRNLEAVGPGTTLEIPDRSGWLYVVKSGDFLSTICSKFNLSMGYEALMEVNGLKNDQIKEGQKLFIPDETAVPSIASAAEGVEFEPPLRGHVSKTGWKEKWTDPATKRSVLLDGVLFKTAEGAEVRAAAGGTVAEVASAAGSPQSCRLKIEHDGGYASHYLYLDMDSLRVAADDKVAAGDVLGTVTSASSPIAVPMLLFKIEQNSMMLDPDLYF